jgi:regulator of replication initiation timing
MTNTSNDATEQTQEVSSSPQAQEATSTTQEVNEQRQFPSEALRFEFEALRRENRNLRDRFKEQERAAQTAEQQRLAEQGQYKELAEKHEVRVKELEPIAESYTRLALTMNAQIEAEIKDWPPEVKSLVPSADVPVESRLEHMTRLRPLLEKLQVQARGTQPGNSPNPRPSGQTPDGARDEYEKRMYASGKYPRA